MKAGVVTEKNYQKILQHVAVGCVIPVFVRNLTTFSEIVLSEWHTLTHILK
jgi:hypothetical protein